MNAAQFRRLEALYDEAAPMAPAERVRFIQDSCADDEELRRELLAAFGDRGSGFTHIVAHAAASASEVEDYWSGRRMGPYRIVRPLGHGGMGAVYLAVRDDDQFHKEVAIKTLKFELDGRPAVSRFLHERQILAHLEHPYIARLLDGGTTEQGTPYIAMEYVAGVPITEWCDSRHLSIEQRLQLLRQVCEAVEYSHQHLIVHRDIKPGNILVTPDGIPKLLDFGIAKLLDAEAPAPMGTATGAGLMTPDYVSPEQVRGEAVSLATDVYALGAVMYQLLTGQRPHRLERYDAVEIARVVCETEISPPSAHGHRRLRGDLDNIVLKAMQKDPSRRYSSVVGLSDDIRRHLEGLPIVARPDTPIYRTTKFVRRHWIGVSATVAVVVSLAIGAVVAVHEARVAQRRFAQVRELANTFLFQFYDQVAPLAGSTAVRASIVETARKYLDGLSKEAGGDTDLVLELAQAYERLGNVQGVTRTSNLGQVADARRSFKNALDLYEQLPARDRSSPAVRLRIARVLQASSRLEYSSNHEDAADGFTSRMLRMLDGLRDPEARLLRAVGERSLGDIRLRQGRPAEALALMESAFRALQELRSAGFNDQALSQEIGTTQERLASARVGTGDLDGAANAYQELLRTTEPCDERNPSPAICRRLVVRLGAAADVYGAVDRPNLDEPARAASLYEQSLHVKERIAALDDHDRQARFDLASGYGKLGDVVWKAEPRRALDLYDRALKTAQALASKEQLEILRDSYLVAISRPLIRLGRFVEARKALEEALDRNRTDEQSLYPDRLGEISIRGIWPRLLIAEGHHAAARRALEELIRDTDALRSAHPEDLTPVFFLSDSCRTLASIATGPQRRAALLQSARAWHSWPATTFTRREEQKDLDAANR